MTHKEIADHGRKLLKSAKFDLLLDFFNELDPPRPKRGKVVRFRAKFHPEWALGIAVPDGIVPAGRLNACWNWDAEGLEWKPARILADDEVALSADLWAAIRDAVGWETISEIAKLVERAEAERMEAE